MSRILLYGTSFPREDGGSAAARALLALALRDAWGWAGAPPMSRGEFGKPRFPAHPSRRFNLSHTAGLCLCALACRRQRRREL